MRIGSMAHIASVTVLLLLFGGAWLFLRKRSGKTQKLVIFILSVLNVLQHLFKSVLYPNHAGEGFTAYSTAYNVCACLILLTPVAIILKNRGLKSFCMCVGACAGAGAIVFPVWYLGMPVSQLSWEYNRFFICHSLLFLTSLLYLVLGLHKVSYRDFWKMGLCLLLILCIILLNDTVCIVIGLFPGHSAATLYESLVSLNPFSLMAPREGFEGVTAVITALSPPVFVSGNPAGTYVPILWYAVPLYTVVSLVALGLFGLLDRNNFVQDIKMLKNRILRKKKS